MKMKRVLILDDERAIREGVSLVVREEFPSFVIFTVGNGDDAYRLIQAERIDICLTDLMVPGLCGLDLIQHCAEEGFQTIFIVLSGYGEFQYASRAMQNRVCHYLLKPVDEGELLSCVREAAEELDRQSDRELHIESVEKALNSMKTRVLCDCLREYILMGKPDGILLEKSRETFGGNGKSLWVAVCTVDSGVNEYDIKLLPQARIFFSDLNEQVFCILIENTIVSVFSLRDGDGPHSLLEKFIMEFPDVDITAGVSGSGSFECLPALYRQAEAAVSYKFYTGFKTVLRAEKYPEKKNSGNSWELNRSSVRLEQFSEAIEERNREKMLTLLNDLFEELCSNMPPAGKARECISLYALEIIQRKEINFLCDPSGFLSDIYKSKTLEAAFQSLNQLVEKLFVPSSGCLNAIVKKMLSLIDKNLQNECLTLNLLAEQKLFMNCTYLGRLFKKQMGISFSQYVTLLRVEKAKDLLESRKEYKVYEVSQKVGFGENPQYFSQIFRKYTGESPTVYQHRVQRPKAL